MAPSLRGSP